MNITRASIEKNRITLTVLFAVIAVGFSSYTALARDSMPPYTIRVASIVTQFPGASPERVERLVTDPIEKIAQELPELKEVNSNSRTGLSVVNVTLKNEVAPEELQPVWDRLRRKLQAADDLPEGVSPFLKDEGLGEVYGIVVGLSSDGFSYAEMKEVADDIRDDLINIDAAAKVEIGGAQDERIFIEFDNARLREYGLTTNRLRGVIASTNILDSGGAVNVEDERVVLEPTGNFDSVETIAQTLIPLGGRGQVVQLSDIARIRRGYVDPPTQLVRVNGREALTLHVNLKEGENIIELGEQIDALVAEWQTSLPIGLELARVSSVDTYIDQKVADFMVNLIQAIVIVLGVMLFFLGLRTGLVVASLIPTVMIATFMLMGLFDIGINQITLAALIMALGMMVDNGIVVAESISVRVGQGIAGRQAAIEAGSELFTPLLISTLTTSAAFLAFFLAESVMGDIVGPIFVVITFALLSSWLLSLSIIALFCAIFLKVEEGRKPGLVDRVIIALRHVYKRMILAALARKVSVLGAVFAAFVLSIFGFGFMAFVFFPDSDRNMVTIDLTLQEGTRIERTDEVVRAFETFIGDSLVAGPDTLATDWSSFIGKGPESYDIGYAAEEANSNYGHILVNTTSFELNQTVIDRLDAFGFHTLPEVEVKVAPLGGGGGGVPVEVKIAGDDPDELVRIGQEIRAELGRIPGTKNVKDDWGPKIKKFVVEIDPPRAQLAGITNDDVATSLRTVLDGLGTGEYRGEDEGIPILMRGVAEQQQTLASLETTDVFAQDSGESVPLLQVAGIIPVWQYAKILREDLARTLIVSSELTATGNAAQVTAELTPFLDAAAETWPAGYTYSLGGDAENTAENMGAVVRYLPLSGFIILVLLVLQFNSFRKVVMVVATIPLALIGVVIGLLVFREPFGFMPFLGVISLAGIVINNAIVLLDRIQIEQELGRKIEDAVIVACLQRFRPILLATFTTVLGLIPLYISGGEIWEGMAIGIMVGLLFGTIITLVFIPSAYSLLFRVDYRGYEFDEALMP